MNSEPTKKRRGRPRKNPVVETVVETKKEEYTVDMPKKKSGRPRKNPEVVSQVEATENKAKTVKKQCEEKDEIIKYKKSRNMYSIPCSTADWDSSICRG